MVEAAAQPAPRQHQRVRARPRHLHRSCLPLCATVSMIKRRWGERGERERSGFFFLTCPIYPDIKTRLKHIQKHQQYYFLPFLALLDVDWRYESIAHVIRVYSKDKLPAMKLLCHCIRLIPLPSRDTLPLPLSPCPFTSLPRSSCDVI